MRFAAPSFAVLLVSTAILAGSAPEARAVDYDCSDFSSQAAAQEFFIAAGGPGSDPHRLDADGDGIACESNPCPCSTTGGSYTPPPTPVVPTLPPPPSPEPTPTRVGVILERVIDGDTLEVRFPDDSLASVRLIGIDTPEKYGVAECAGEDASVAMSRRVQPGQRLRLIRDPSQDNLDQYGRLLRYVEVWGSGRDLGQMQVQSGWAKVYVFESPFKRLPEYKLAAKQARRHERGAWLYCGGGFHLDLP